MPPSAEEENMAEQREFELPTSLKNVLAKLPGAEAVQIINDLGKLAWVIDNNNNNNAKGKLEERFLEKLTILSPERLAQILETKG